MKFGYVRVSTRAQNETRQVQKLQEAGVAESNILVDKATGKDFERDSYRLLKEKVRAGDEVYFLSLDRLGRNYDEMQREWSWFLNKGVGVAILDFSLLNTTGAQVDGLDNKFVAELVFKVMAYLSEKERIQILERTAQGRAVAQAKGVKFGRPPVKLPEHFDTLVMNWKSREMRLCDCVAQSGLKRASFVKYANIRYEVLRNGGDLPVLVSHVSSI